MFMRLSSTDVTVPTTPEAALGRIRSIGTARDGLGRHWGGLKCEKANVYAGWDHAYPVA